MNIVKPVSKKFKISEVSPPWIAPCFLRLGPWVWYLRIFSSSLFCSILPQKLIINTPCVDCSFNEITTSGIVIYNDGLISFESPMKSYRCCKFFLFSTVKPIWVLRHWGKSSLHVRSGACFWGFPKVGVLTMIKRDSSALINFWLGKARNTDQVFFSILRIRLSAHFETVRSNCKWNFESATESSLMLFCSLWRLHTTWYGYYITTLFKSFIVLQLPTQQAAIMKSRHC